MGKPWVIVGLDEVGRGAWAGPLVAAAVILPVNISGLKDSKLLSKNQRLNLKNQIVSSSLCGVGWVWPAEIDKIGLTAAVRLAMQKALSKIKSNYDQVIIDGAFNFLANNPKSVAIVKADGTEPSVSAASILAKVVRDEYMHKISSHYPTYSFEAHVGYGTRAHADALKKFGICKLHRQSFKPIKAYLI